MENILKSLMAFLKSIFCRDKKDGGITTDALKGQKGFAVSTIEGESNFPDILAWFRSQNLDPKRHTPFIANFIPFKDKIGDEVTQLTKPCALLVGIYDEQEGSITAEVFECDALDAKTREVLGSEELVVLQ